jgi:hypothetical protein
VESAVSVKVVFSPVFRAVFMRRELEVVLSEPQASVGGLLAYLSKASSGKIDNLVFDKSAALISAALMVQVNDKTYTGNALNQQPVTLRDQDIVTLLYYISGG